KLSKALTFESTEYGSPECQDSTPPSCQSRGRYVTRFTFTWCLMSYERYPCSRSVTEGSSPRSESNDSAFPTAREYVYDASICHLRLSLRVSCSSMPL